MTGIEEIVKEIKTRNEKYADNIKNGQVVYFINKQNEVCEGIVTNKYSFPDASKTVIDYEGCTKEIPHKDVYIDENDAKTVVYAEDYKRLQSYMAEIKDKDSLIKFMFEHNFTKNQDWTVKFAIRYKAKEFGLDISD